MKNTFLLALILSITFSNCTQVFYQVHETKPIDASSHLTADGKLKFSYNFWQSGGMMSFVIHNTSDKPIYIDFDRSHFILNGFTYDYFTDLEEMSSITSSSSVGVLALSKYSTTANTSSKTTQIVSQNKSKQKRIREIPSNSKITFQYADLYPFIFQHCDLSNNVAVKKLSTIEFTPSDSPIVFSNYITYSAKYDCSDPLITKSEFYSSKVMNMTEARFKGKSVYKEKCGKKLITKVYPFPYATQSNFYNKYTSIDITKF